MTNFLSPLNDKFLVSPVGRDAISVTTDTDMVIPVVNETLVSSTRVVETGKVRIRTIVDTEDYELLDRSNIEIEEIAIIPVVEEVLVVRRQLMLVKELRVRRVVTTERVQQTFTARKMRGR